MNELTEAITKTIASSHGKWSIVLEDLDLKQTWKVNENDPIYAASIIKLPIMATVFHLAHREEVKLGDLVTLQKEDIVGGSGVLQHLSPGLEFTVYDLTMLMIIQSDNTATNMLINIIGTKQIQKTMEILGMSSSTFYNKLMTVPVKLIGRNMITAADIALLLQKLATGKAISLYACEQMIDIMKKQQLHYLTTNFPQTDPPIVGVNPNWAVASKTGMVTRILHDVGIFYIGNRSMAVTVLSKDVNYHIALETMSNIGKHVYNYLANSQAKNN